MTNMVNNYEVLGIQQFTPLQEGWTECAITNIENANQQEFLRTEDIALIVHFKPHGKGDYEYSMILSGSFKREDGKIIGAGSAFVVIDFFNALGVIAINNEGKVMENAFKDCVSDKPNINLFMYKAPSKDNSKAYWRAYKRVLPISASEEDKERLTNTFFKDVKAGYIKYIAQQTPTEGKTVNVHNVTAHDEL